MCPCHASLSKHNCSLPWHFHNRLEGEAPNTGVFSSIAFKPPLCSAGPDFNIQMQLGGAVKQWTRRCEAISREQRVAVVASVFITHRRVGSLNCPCWERWRLSRSVSHLDSHQDRHVWLQRSDQGENRSCTSYNLCQWPLENCRSLAQVCWPETNTNSHKVTFSYQRKK